LVAAVTTTWDTSNVSLGANCDGAVRRTGAISPLGADASDAAEPPSDDVPTPIPVESPTPGVLIATDGLVTSTLETVPQLAQMPDNAITNSWV
jgi:hypothetical protein